MKKWREGGHGWWPVHLEVLVLPLPKAGGHLLVQWGPAGFVHEISGKCAGRKGFPKKTEPTQRNPDKSYIATK